MNSRELLTVVEQMERERGIDRDAILSAVESAILSGARKSVSPAQNLRIVIDRKTCEMKAFAALKIVEQVQHPHDEISLEEARRIKPDARLGETIEKEVTPKNLGRIAAQTAKQAIINKIRQIDRDRIYLEYKDRVGQLVTGIVRRFDRSDVILELSRAEGIIPARERVPTEEYQIGDTICALILRVEPASQGSQIILSRSHPDFVRRLFEREVSEIADKTVEIKAIAREPGFRTKVAVVSHDEKVDPVGACVGMRGMRVKNIVRELSGEKIDIVRWSEDIKTFVSNALAPARLTRVIVDESTRTVRVITDAEQLSLAIGKKGQNARLTAKLTGWKVDIQRDESAKSFEEKVAEAISSLASVPGIGPDLAERLVHAGFLTVEQIVAAAVEDLQEVEGLDAEKAKAVHEAAARVFEEAGSPAEADKPTESV